MLRVMSMQMMGGVSAVYFYQLGYSLQWLAWYFVIYFSFRICISPLVAITVARYGPKHGTLISNILFVISAAIMAAIPYWGVFAFVLLVPVSGFSRSLYDVCYLVDFSKVKHTEHSGKELGLMQIIERVMLALGPILGGVVALLFGPIIMMLFAGFLMMSSTLPLFFTSEPVKVHQKITLRHFNIKVAWKPMLAQIAAGLDMNASGLLWNLFIVIVIFGSVSNSSYLQLGILSSVALFASIGISYIYGKLVDNRKGRTLLKISVVGDSLVYLSRYFISTPFQVAGVNVANEVVTTGYMLPALRGIFDTADGLPGYRIIYITLMETMLVIGDTISVLTLAILLSFMTDQHALRSIYLILAPVLLLIMLHTTAVYRRGVLTRFIHRV
ncbi:MAG: MFS transporter [Candidatus Saccharibacteria bacterium]|nr:MFS transporter [Candidatus Saccharibacteria bacterium]